jgi:uncharacterized membrane protein
MELYQAALNVGRLSILAFGSLVVFMGIVRAVFEARGAGGRGRVARQILYDAALGLEFFIGATLLNLMLDPTWKAVATIALTIVARKLLTVSLGLES